VFCTKTSVIYVPYYYVFYRNVFSDITSPGWTVSFLVAVMERSFCDMGRMQTVAPGNSLAILQSSNICFCSVFTSFILFRVTARFH
jgi:hypothetical protein